MDEQEGLGGLAFAVMLAFGYAVAESITNAMGCEPLTEQVVMRVDTGLYRKKNS